MLSWIQVSSMAGWCSFTMIYGRQRGKEGWSQKYPLRIFLLRHGDAANTTMTTFMVRRLRECDRACEVWLLNGDKDLAKSSQKWPLKEASISVDTEKATRVARLCKKLSVGPSLNQSQISTLIFSSFLIGPLAAFVWTWFPLLIWREITAALVQFILQVRFLIKMRDL